MTHIARSSLIIAVFFGLDKVLGFVRQVFVARQFALTYEIDVFNAANNIPDLLSALISGGALGVALIPVLSEYLEVRGRPAAWDLFARIVNLAFLVTAGLAVLIVLFARPFVDYVIAPGFPEAQKALTTELMRLDLLAILVFSISGLVMAGLQANQHFILPAMAPGLYNLGQIFGVTVLSPGEALSFGPVTLPAFGLGIHGLVYGVILGALLHLLIQVPGLVRYHFKWTPAIDLRHPGVRRVLALLGPRVATMFFLQMFFIARDNLASRLGEGAVTALNYGWFIMQVPETLIGTALAIALLPTLAEHFARGEDDLFHQTVNRALRVLLALTLPAAALLAAALPPLVKTIFDFEASGVERVVWATRGYLLGLAGHSMLEVAARSFYARQDARTPLFAAALNAGAYVVFAISFSSLLGATGIALANSLAFTGEALLLLYLLNRRLPSVVSVRSTLLRALAGSLGAGGLVLLVMQLPLPGLLSPLAALAAGGLLALPFIWPEIRLLQKL
ncbi:MAG TPA: murein biosynthesis integral membrane protein MurJ [Anaerolineales bacterium]|nr:murein biosynthesis integral membrane protein MurJ [Anaerolineales bacterium]